MTTSRQRLPASSPGTWGAVLGDLLGLGLAGIGIDGMLRGSLPLPLTLGLLVGGLLLAALCGLTFYRVRAAWAFALSICGTSGLVFLFSAPKIRDALDVSLGIALLPCVAGAAAAILLAMASAEIKSS